MAKLTMREAEVVAGVAEGLTNKEIATRLSMSPGTVKRHIWNVMEKTGMSTRTELAVHHLTHKVGKLEKELAADRETIGQLHTRITQLEEERQTHYAIHDQSDRYIYVDGKPVYGMGPVR